MLPEQLKEFPVAAAIESFDPSAITGGQAAHAELALDIDPGKIVSVCRFLREQQAFIRLSSVTATDWHPAEPRFRVVYHLHSLERNSRARLKCPLPGENPEIDSITAVWPGAAWYEREIFDLFGIGFRKHPNLTRILMPDNWEGYPLRKDYPVHGYKYSYKD